MNSFAKEETQVLPVRLSSPYSQSIVVDPYGFPMTCEYEYEEGESPIFWPTERAHPGSPSNVALLSCKVGGVDLMDMLKPEQVERIEGVILDAIE